MSSAARPAIHPLMLRAMAASPRPTKEPVAATTETPQVKANPVGDGLLKVIKAAS